MYTSSTRALKYMNQIPRDLKRETDSNATNIFWDLNALL